MNKECSCTNSKERDATDLMLYLGGLFDFDKKADVLNVFHDCAAVVNQSIVKDGKATLELMIFLIQHVKDVEVGKITEIFNLYLECAASLHVDEALTIEDEIAI